MISQLNISSKNNSNKDSHSQIYNNKTKFRGMNAQVGTIAQGCGKKAIALVQKCEKEPMINVAVIDLLTAILPRSIWESLTNLFAGFEALRRESSGLLVNCLIPGFITLGIAKLANKGIMGKNKSNLANCWASSNTIDKVTEHYKNSESTEAFQEGMRIFKNKKHARVYAVNFNLLSEASGVDGFNRTSFNQVMSHEELSDSANKLTRMMFESDNGKLSENIVSKTPSKRLKAVFRFITRRTHIAQDVTFKSPEGGTELVSKLDRTLTDTHQLLKGIIKEGIEPKNVSDFVRRSKNLLKTKSVIGMAIVLPLAASMQFINRKITEKLSGVKGAPIHDDYGKNASKTDEQIKKEKQSLIGRKIWAVSSMLGIAMLSMMKVPNMKTLKNIVQFKDQFPTMDQARAISAITFASRMAVADDEAELKEAHTRDIITFSSMYFLGDYGAKAAASYLEKKTGIELLNKTYKPTENKGIFKKAKNWILNTHLKSSDELKGTGAALEKALSLRAKCQMANLGTSLAILGVIVPIYTRLRTKKHDAMKREQNNNVLNNTSALRPRRPQERETNFMGSNNLKKFSTLSQFRTKAEVTQS